MDLRVVEEVRYGGERHSAGSVLRDVPIATGRRLLLGGYVEHLGSAVAEVDPDPGDDDSSLEILKVPELKQLATDLGLEFTSSAKKGDLLEIIQAELDRLAAEESDDAGEEDNPAENPSGDDGESGGGEGETPGPESTDGDDPPADGGDQE